MNKIGNNKLEPTKHYSQLLILHFFIIYYKLNIKSLSSYEYSFMEFLFFKNLILIIHIMELCTNMHVYFKHESMNLKEWI